MEKNIENEYINEVSYTDPNNRYNINYNINFHDNKLNNTTIIKNMNNKNIHYNSINNHHSGCHHNSSIGSYNYINKNTKFRKNYKYKGDSTYKIPYAGGDSTHENPYVGGVSTHKRPYAGNVSTHESPYVGTTSNIHTTNNQIATTNPDFSLNDKKFIDFRKKQNIYCVNCGEKGHIVKECSAPITSYGIIAFKINKSQEFDKYDKNDKLNNILKSEFICDKSEEYPRIKFLMIQRKDTIGYIDFIRGKYTDLDTCINEMTKNEKLNLLTKTFDELWNELWICNKTHENFYKQEYYQAKNKFNKLDINNLVRTIESKFLFQEFSFPKGRRNIRERNIDCAEREFFEETQYNKETYQFIKNYPTIEETFTGTNGIVYKHIYYLVKMRDDIKPPCVNTNNKTQLSEVQNIGWFTYDECLHLIRPYDNEKKKILSDVYNDIINMNGNYECSDFYYKTVN